MTEIRFYHLQTQTLEQALPQILNKSLETGRRVVVKAGSDKDVKHLNDYLWTYHPDSFLPHGSKVNGHAQDQPVWLTTEDENPNGADVLVLTGGQETQALSSFSLCCEMLDGRDEQAVAAGRERYRKYRDDGYEITYWRQGENGGWEKKE